MRIEKLQENFNIEVELVHFPLHPDTPLDGQTLQQLFPGRTDEQIEAQYQNMKGLCEAEGLPYGKRTHTYNSRLAQELGKWADTQDGGAALHDALYRAYFVDARNIGDVDVLLDLVEKAGLPVEEAKTVLTDRTFKDAIDADWSRSHQIGVTGVPTFVAGGYGVVGAQPYEALAQLITHVETEAAKG